MDVAAVERIDRKPLQACCTVDSNQRHRGKREQSVAAEAVHKGHNHLRDNGEEVGTGDSESNNGHIDEDVGAGVEDAVEAMMTGGTAYDMEVAEVDAWGDAWGALFAAGEEPSNDEGAGVEMDGVFGEPAGERGVEAAGEEVRTCGVEAGAVVDTQEQMAEAEGRWP